MRPPNICRSTEETTLQMKRVLLAIISSCPLVHFVRRALLPHLTDEASKAQECEATRPAPPGTCGATPGFLMPESSHFSRLSLILTLPSFLSFFLSGSDEQKAWTEWLLIVLTAAICFLFVFSLTCRRQVFFTLGCSVGLRDSPLSCSRMERTALVCHVDSCLQMGVDRIKD